MDYKSIIHHFTHGNVLKKGTLLLCLFAYTGIYAQDTVHVKSKWLDDYPRHEGFKWSAGADVVSNYIWRGLQVAGLGVQPDITVGYAGVYLNVWGSMNATDWTFQKINPYMQCAFYPELDLTLGFSRWGLDIKYMHMYYFDKYADGTPSRFFDYKDNYHGEGGVTQEWRIKYRVSNKLPLHVMWCTRTFGRDGYPTNIQYNEEGKAVSWDRKRAYSSYLEIGYEFALPYQLTLYANLGMTPWKSLYTKYQGDFAVVDIDAKLMRSWDLSKHCYMTAFAQVMINPYDIARTSMYNINVQKKVQDNYFPINFGQQFLWNIGCGVYFK